jgi:hypothetical protein
MECHCNIYISFQELPKHTGDVHRRENYVYKIRYSDQIFKRQNIQ